MGHKIKCLKCGETIEGDMKGHMIWCKCKSVAIDETPYYARFIGEFEDYKEVKDDKGIS